jgi:hypothetical protein
MSKMNKMNKSEQNQQNEQKYKLQKAIIKKYLMDELIYHIKYKSLFHFLHFDSIGIYVVESVGNFEVSIFLAVFSY